jgi:cell division protein FtsW (lipid II flippase)
MSEVFNFRRFLTFFKYDLKQMWRNHFKVALFLGFLPLLLYIVWVICSLSFTREWTAPGIAVRAGFFYLAVLVIILYQARTYGHLTDRRKGANYLMIPASVTE